MGVEKHPENVDERKFLSWWSKCQEFLELEGFECMSRNKFEFNHKNLDKGPDIEVSKAGQPQYQILNLGQKFGGVLDHFNSVLPTLRTPDRKFPLV